VKVLRAQQRSSPSVMVPAQLCNSPLLRKGGFEVFAGLLDDNGQRLMLSEAVQLSGTAHLSDEVLSDNEEVRGGNPARRFLSAAGGKIQDAFYTAPWLIRFLRDITGVVLVPTGRYGSFTYYAHPGDHLTVHRDVELCDVAVITCLYESPGLAGTGGLLCLYPGRLCERLSTIRATPAQGAVKLRLMPRQTIVMLGGLVPHAVLPVADKQVRIVSVLCYRLARELR
jgi:hypothetical protein